MTENEVLLGLIALFKLARINYRFAHQQGKTRACRVGKIAAHYELLFDGV